MAEDHEKHWDWRSVEMVRRIREALKAEAPSVNRPNLQKGNLDTPEPVE